MLYSLDYLAFTVGVASAIDSDSEATFDFIVATLMEVLPPKLHPVISRGGWERYKGKGFYAHRAFHVDSKATVFWGGVNAHIYVEFPGQTCDVIESLGGLEDLTQLTGMSVSRVDFAVDIENDIHPQEFIVNYEAQRFSASARILSADGETCYVGSWKSERFARVYRYHPPHPRANMLRIETVMKGDYARAAMWHWRERGLKQAVIDSNEPFGWQHPCWQPGQVEALPIASQRVQRTHASTLRWLTMQVAPALAKAHREGVISVRQWVEDNVIPIIDQKR